MTDRSVRIEEIIAEHATSMAKEMVEIATWAKSEEDVRHECNKLIDEFLKKAGINIKGRHEYGLAGGYIDSKYGGVIIEYKYPKGSEKLTDDSNSPGNKAVIKQIKRRFKDFQGEERIEPERLFAVGCDGDTFIFVRYRGGKYEVDEPTQVTQHAVERLLRALVSLGAQGISYTPDHLAEQFGADSEVAQKGIHDIYRVIVGTKDKKAKTFFGQWKILFGEVCGYDIEGKNEKIKKLGDHYKIPNARPPELLFSVHTYYAIFMKFLSAEITQSFSLIGASIIKRCVNAPTSSALKREMKSLEQGGIWSQLGITNFLEGDLFSWYIAAWNDRIAEVVWDIVRTLDQYDPTTLSVDPIESRDLLKKLYQHLFPKSVRHDLGEYYTPDWLAEHVLNELGYTGDPDKRMLDPACGSGTFLVMAINRVMAWFEENREKCGFGEDELVKKILHNIIGFDLNPLAVMAARTNYLLALRGLLKFASVVEIPVYLCDSIMTPAEYGTEITKRGAVADLWRSYKGLKLKTSVGEFFIPSEIAASREIIGKYSEVVEFCVRNNFSAEDFITRCKEDALPVSELALHEELYEHLRRLDLNNQNGIWARIIKNAFAPLFIERVDYVAGNPPWINWESLPNSYRDSMKPLWREYGLFTLSGSAGRLGGGKKDLSMLFVYGSVDNYLNDGGRLGFVITQTVFKTIGAGDGFRQLRFKKNGKSVILKPIVVHDLSSIQLFEGATNRTAVFICEKTKKKFNYPVPYILWQGPSRINQEETLLKVKSITSRKKLGAIPVDTQNANSPWLTTTKRALMGVQKIMGKSDYRAYAGCSTWLNGVFWIRVVKKLNDGNLLIENLHNVGKIKIESHQAVIESDLVYPLLRGRDVSQWNAEPSTFIILSQDAIIRAGIPESQMKREYPKTYAYLKKFESLLRKRSGYKKYFKPTDPFYSIYNVGAYTLSDWKVVWRDMGARIQAAVIGKQNGETILPEHHVMAVPLSSNSEAHYLCGLLMSSPVQLIVSGYTTTTGISTHILNHIAIPQFNPRNKIHNRLSTLSNECHAIIASGNIGIIKSIELEIDDAAAKLWHISDKELKIIQNTL